MDYEAWRCMHDDELFCPPEGCPKYRPDGSLHGCARDHGWRPAAPRKGPAMAGMLDNYERCIEERNRLRTVLTQASIYLAEGVQVLARAGREEIPEAFHKAAVLLHAETIK